MFQNNLKGHHYIIHCIIQLIILFVIGGYHPDIPVS